MPNQKVPADGVYSLVVGDRFLDSRLGIIAAGSYQNTYNRTETDYYTLGTDVNANLKPYQSTLDNRVYGTQKMRGGIAIKSDYIMQIDQQISASYIYVDQVEELTRHGLQTTIDGTRGAADLTYSNLSALRTQTISNFSVSGEHFTLSPLTLRWTTNYSDAIQNRPDQAEYNVMQNYDHNGDLEPFQGLDNITHSWRKNDDKQYLAKGDISYQLTSGNMHSIQAGASYQELKRVNFQNDYKLNPSIINGQTQPFTTIDSAKVTPVGFGGTPVFGFQNYKAQEALLSGYIQYVLNTNSLQVLTGVRWEQARDMYWTQAPITAGKTQDTVMFVDFLPSIHIRYAFTPDNIIRFSATRTLSRPSYFDLVPAKDQQDESETDGNSLLRCAHSTNIDLRYEYIPSIADQISFGIYAKKITGPIENQFTSSGVVFVTSKINGNPADVYGIEVAGVKHIGDFGFSANYTYVYSSITEKILVPTLDENGSPIIPVPSFIRKRPLQDQSPSVANAAISYQNKQLGTGMQLSYNYTGKRLIAVSPIDGWDTYEDGVGEWDGSIDQQIFPGLKLSVKLINLLNSQDVIEVPSGDQTKHPSLVVERNFIKFRGSVGFTYRF